MDKGLLRAHIVWAEGFRRFPYRDTVGKLSVGVGRNLDDVGIRRSEAMFMLENDMADAILDASSMPFWGSLDPVRRLVISDMVFNLGLTKFRRFIRLNKALVIQDYSLASHEMTDSKWYRQVGRRAKVLVEAMQTGIWK